MNCPDGNDCDTWFISDGGLVCRHGFACKDFLSKNTAVNFICPLEIQQKHEEQEWNIFWEMKDDIIREVLSKRIKQ